MLNNRIRDDDSIGSDAANSVRGSSRNYFPDALPYDEEANEIDLADEST